MDVRTRGAARRLLERIREIAERSPKRRQRSGKQRNTEHGGGPEEKHMQIEAYIGRERKRAGEQRFRDANQGIGNADTRDASQDAQRKTLGEQLREQAAATGPKRSPNSQFYSARRTFGKQQICHVGAGDEKNEENGSERDGNGAFQVRSQEQPRQGFNNN